MEWSLSIAWKQLTSFSHINRAEISRPLKVVFHKCTLHRARMMHVVTNLAAFLMFEVMESAWVTLGDKVRTACCLDEVIAAHDAYLLEVLDKALLAPHHEQLNVLVQALLQSILRFCSLEDMLITGSTLFYLLVVFMFMVFAIRCIGHHCGPSRGLQPGRGAVRQGGVGRGEHPRRRPPRQV